MAQSKAELTTDKQIFYLVQWFAEFSDFQRTDFLQDHLLPLYQEFLKSKFFGPDASGDNETDEKKVANGVSSIDLDNERPPSIFQCRMSLLAEWYLSWSSSDRVEFLIRLKNIDSGFVKQFLFHFFETPDNYAKIVKDDDLVERLALDETFGEELKAFVEAKQLEVPSMPVIAQTNGNHGTVEIVNGDHDIQDGNDTNQQPQQPDPVVESDKQQIEVDDTVVVNEEVKEDVEEQQKEEELSSAKIVEDVATTELVA